MGGSAAWYQNAESKPEKPSETLPRKTQSMQGISQLPSAPALRSELKIQGPHQSRAICFLLSFVLLDPVLSSRRGSHGSGHCRHKLKTLHTSFRCCGCAVCPCLLPYPAYPTRSLCPFDHKVTLHTASTLAADGPLASSMSSFSGSDSKP